MKENIHALMEIDKMKALCDKINRNDLFLEYLDCRGQLQEELFMIKLESIVKAWVASNPSS